jgi:membrane-associated phospholipid phosphatase
MEEVQERLRGQQVASLVSLLFHPLLMPLYATWLLLHSGNYLSYALAPKLQQFLYIVVFVSTWLLPSMTAWMMWQKKWISSLEMPERKERHLPFLFTLVCYIAGIYLLFQLPVSRLFALTVTGAALAILFSFLVNLKWKISIHMVGLGGLMGLFYGYGRHFHMQNLWILVLIAIAAGITASARLYREAHSPLEVYAGFIAGFVLEYEFISFVAGLLVE